MSIAISKKHGANARLTICPICGGDGSALALLGTANYILECTHCGVRTYGAKNKRNCPECGSKHSLKMVRELFYGEPVVSNEPCGKCKEKKRAAEEAVKEGGIFWRCADCKAEGAIKAENALAKKIREQSGIKAPDPVGIEFTKKNCPVCSKSGEEHDQN